MNHEDNFRISMTVIHMMMFDGDIDEMRMVCWCAKDRA